MKTEKKFLKEMNLVIKARGGTREIHTTFYVDSTIVDTVIGRGKIVDVDSVQFIEKQSKECGWWCCRRAEVADLIDHLKDVRSYNGWLFRC
jgi:predicted nucleic-acid-binding Zn-ribbon protein